MRPLRGRSPSVRLALRGLFRPLRQAIIPDTDFRGAGDQFIFGDDVRAGRRPLRSRLQAAKRPSDTRSLPDHPTAPYAWS